jgi:hypothetical protein
MYFPLPRWERVRVRVRVRVSILFQYFRNNDRRVGKHPLAGRVAIDGRFYIAKDLRYSSLLCYFDSREI